MPDAGNPRRLSNDAAQRHRNGAGNSSFVDPGSGNPLIFGSPRQPIQRLDFIVIGAQKAGTTALNYYLRRHPQIALPRRKELHFFDAADERFATSNVDYARLHAWFEPARPGARAGENTPNYLYWPAAMSRIRDYNPGIKLIILLRNPIERAFSQWNMQRSRKIEPLDFLQAIEHEPHRLRMLPPLEARKFAYASRGKYGDQLERVFSLFERSQVLALKYEEFRLRQREQVEEVFEFLDVRIPRRFKAIEAHSIPYARPLRMDERAVLRPLFNNDIGRVEQLLGWDCSDWQ